MPFFVESLNSTLLILYKLLLGRLRSNTHDFKFKGKIIKDQLIIKFLICVGGGICSHQAKRKWRWLIWPDCMYECILSPMLINDKEKGQEHRSRHPSVFPCVLFLNGRDSLAALLSTSELRAASALILISSANFGFLTSVSLLGQRTFSKLS
jgi:hypothetical protein